MTIKNTQLFAHLHSADDVVGAWHTLLAVWMRIFPEWPVAAIALRVIHQYKRFAHCHGSARRVAVEFSDKLLATNAQRAAATPPRGPLSYERSSQLARAACQDASCPGDPDVGLQLAQMKTSGGGNNTQKVAPSTKGKTGNNSHNKSSGGGGRNSTHGGPLNAGGAGGNPRGAGTHDRRGGGLNMTQLLGDAVRGTGGPLCPVYNTNNCHTNSPHCTRKSGNFLHKCSYR